MIKYGRPYYIIYGSSKNHRRIVRRKGIEHFRTEDGVLYYACGRVCERD